MPEKLILGRYRPVSRIGSGGFAEVSLAWDTRLQRRVAIKSLKLDEETAAMVEGADDVSAYDLDRIPGLAEARTAAMFQDPNIAGVLDFGVKDGFAYFIMEYVDGITLADLLAEFQDYITLDVVAAVFAGVLLVNGSVRGGNADMTGLLCGAASAMLYAVMITENKRAVHITGQENAALQLLFGFLTAAVFVGIRDRGFAIDVRPDDWGWIVLLGAVNTGLGCYWYFSAIGQLPVQTVAVCGYLEPLAAVVCAAALLNETMQPLQILGAVLILGGAAGAECVPMLLQRRQKC